MVEYGFSLNEIESFDDYDIREIRCLKEQMNRNRQINDLMNRLNICDAVLHAVAAVQSKKGYSAYKRWHNRIRGKINKLMGKKQATVWDKMKRRSSKIG